MSTHAHERRKHPRLPMHLSIAKMVDFQCDGLEAPAPAVLVDLSAGGLAMVCFGLPHLAKNVTFKMDLPGLVSANIHGEIVRATRKGESYQVGVKFTEFQHQWAHLVEKLAKAYQHCEDRLQQGDRRFCVKDCSFFSLCQKDEKARVFPKAVTV